MRLWPVNAENVNVGIGDFNFAGVGATTTIIHVYEQGVFG